MLASLPMYDFPELRPATDAWWSGIARHCRAAGIGNVPPALERRRARDALWRDGQLLLSQTCGHPLVRCYRATLRPVLTPCYDVAGCSGSCYSSVVLVREDDTAAGLDALAGSDFAVNGFDSWSGWQVLLLELALRGTDPARFVAAAHVCGTHRGSLAAVAAGRARACVADCVSVALIGGFAPRETARLRVVHRTTRAPALPYVTRTDHDEVLVQRLRRALRAALADPDLAAERRALAIAGGEVLDIGRYAPMADGSTARALVQPA